MPELTNKQKLDEIVQRADTGSVTEDDFFWVLSLTNGLWSKVQTRPYGFSYVHCPLFNDRRPFDVFLMFIGKSCLATTLSEEMRIARAREIGLSPLYIPLGDKNIQADRVVGYFQQYGVRGLSATKYNRLRERTFETIGIAM